MIKNIFQGVAKKISSEVSETIFSNPTLRIERIISKGHSSEKDFWYDQNQNEWVLVLQGEGRLKFIDGKAVTMKAGDYVNIPAHTKHRVEWTVPDSETIWLAVFY